MAAFVEGTDSQRVVEVGGNHDEYYVKATCVNEVFAFFIDFHAAVEFGGLFAVLLDGVRDGDQLDTIVKLKHLCMALGHGTKSAKSNFNHLCLLVWVVIYWKTLFV